MLQNRVDPFGNIIKTSARGTLMGNRGLLHNDKKEIVRPFKLKAWITCKLEFKKRKRDVMAPNHYTELFFLDEVTSFAAGHRPCFECRRDDYNRFKTSWLKGNPEYGFSKKTSIREIDNILQQERINKDFEKINYTKLLQSLPNGTFISLHNQPYLIHDDLIHSWSAFGYEKGVAFPTTKVVEVLTPFSVVNAFKAGYAPTVFK